MLTQTCLAYTWSHKCYRKFGSARTRPRTTALLKGSSIPVVLVEVWRETICAFHPRAQLQHDECAISITNIVLPDRAIPSRTWFRARVQFCASELSTHDQNLRERIFVVGNSDRKCPMEPTYGQNFQQQAPIEHLLSEIPKVKKVTYNTTTSQEK